MEKESTKNIVRLVHYLYFLCSSQLTFEYDLLTGHVSSPAQLITRKNGEGKHQKYCKISPLHFLCSSQLTSEYDLLTGHVT